MRNYDVDVPANTVRAWVIGLVLCTLGSGINMLFSLRNPTVAITTYVIQLVAYPIGRGWDLIMPDRVWNVFGLKFNLRPGKFNFKEHVVIVAMSNVSVLIVFDPFAILFRAASSFPFSDANPVHPGGLRRWRPLCHGCSLDAEDLL